MATKVQSQMLSNYRLLMEEVKNRIAVLNLLVGGNTGLPNPAIQEFGFLQLRILCELIALACLTAHGDIAEVRSKGLREEWNATTILKRLEQLHPDFYPTPIKMTQKAGYKEMSPIESGFLTKAELIALYGRSSNLIHRGSIAKLLDKKTRWPTENREVIEWGTKIMGLVSHHAIGHMGGATYLLCMLENPDDFKNVQVAFAEANGKVGTPEPPTDPQPAILPGLHPSRPWKVGS